LTLLAGHQEEHLACKQLFSDEVFTVDVVSYLERGSNDMHMRQLMPLPPHHLLLQ